MLLSGTEPELCITEHNFVYEENRAVALTSQYGLVLTRLIDAELYCPDAECPFIPFYPSTPHCGLAGVNRGVNFTR